MDKWNADKYLQFATERTQPAIDLADQIFYDKPLKIIDIGCGPGNSTNVLAQKFPEAYILGIDNSEEMIQAAKENHPNLAFQIYDASSNLSSLGNDFDVVFSNACIQWIPDHHRLIPNMMSLLKNNGILAVQIPMIWEEPVQTILNELAKNTRWSDSFQKPGRPNSLGVHEYHDILSKVTSDFRMWVTIYIHRMKTHNDIIEWYRSTGLRPYLSALPDLLKEQFLAEYKTRLIQEYPQQQNGEILFRFPRFFFVAVK